MNVLIIPAEEFVTVIDNVPTEGATESYLQGANNSHQNEDKILYNIFLKYFTFYPVNTVSPDGSNNYL